VGGVAALDGSERPQSSPSKPRKLQKERAASSRHGSSASDRLARNVTKANGHRDKPISKVKPRETSIEEPRPSSKSMSSTVAKSSKMRLPASPSSGAEYLASVPAETGSRSSPSIVPRQLDTTTQRSISPASSKDESKTSSQPASSGRRILHLMKTLDGCYSGNVLVRRDRNSTWKQIRCSIEGPDGDLCYETRSDDDTPKKVLVPALRGCRVRPSVDGDTPYLEVSLPRKILTRGTLHYCTGSLSSRAGAALRMTGNRRLQRLTMPCGPVSRLVRLLRESGETVLGALKVSGVRLASPDRTILQSSKAGR